MTHLAFPYRLAVFCIFFLGGCAPYTEKYADSNLPLQISILAFNDLHGNLEPPHLSVHETVEGKIIEVPAGGIAYLANAIDQLKKQHPLNAVVSAGDMIGASPLISAMFLDEPTIEAVNAMRIDFNAIGNHEFDKGFAELKRMREGGCSQHTRMQPCKVNKDFAGATFEFLAANVKNDNGQTIFPAYGIKIFKQGKHQVKVGFVGMTLKGTPNIVTPEGVKGLVFEDEASTANELVPVLKAQGVSALVLVIHEGGTVQGGPNDSNCPGLTGDIVPILHRLDPAYDVVVSGHTHRAYTCDFKKFNPSKSFLLSSAGQYGSLLTHIDLKIDPIRQQVVSKSAHNVIIQSESFTNSAGVQIKNTRALPQFIKNQEVQRIVSVYQEASALETQRPVSHLPQSITRQASASRETPLGNLIADAQWAATAAPENGNSDFALMNQGGVRADLLIQVGGGTVNYGQLFKIQPFSNYLVVKSFTGLQIQEMLEQQYSNPQRLRILLPSSNLRYQVNMENAAGHRVSQISIKGLRLEPTQIYRITMNNFLGSGGDGFGIFKAGVLVFSGGLDVDALVDYLVQHPGIPPPSTDRITRM